jgi:hypothetical protein
VESAVECEHSNGKHQQNDSLKKIDPGPLQSRKTECEGTRTPANEK